MNRSCPSCLADSIPVREILFSDCICTACDELIGVHRLLAAISSFLILIVAVLTTLMVYFQVGQWAALVWFTVPIGAMSYLKARFGPLQVKARHLSPIAKNLP